MIIPFGIKYSDSCHNMNLETQANNEKEYFCSHHFLTVLKKLCTFKNKMRLPERPKIYIFFLKKISRNKKIIFNILQYFFDLSCPLLWIYNNKHII